MADQIAYPVLFGTTQASWAPIDLRFELLTGEADPERRYDLKLWIGSGDESAAYLPG